MEAVDTYGIQRNRAQSLLLDPSLFVVGRRDDHHGGLRRLLPYDDLGQVRRVLHRHIQRAALGATGDDHRERVQYRIRSKPEGGSLETLRLARASGLSHAGGPAEALAPKVATRQPF